MNIMTQGHIQQVRTLHETIRSHAIQLDEHDQSKQQLIYQIDSLRLEIHRKNEALSSREWEIQELRKQLQQATADADKVSDYQLESFKQKHLEQLRSLQEQITSQRRFLDECSVHMSQKNQTIALKDQIIAANRKEILQLREQLGHVTLHQIGKGDRATTDSNDSLPQWLAQCRPLNVHGDKKFEKKDPWNQPRQQLPRPLSVSSTGTAADSAISIQSLLTPMEVNVPSRTSTLTKDKLPAQLLMESSITTTVEQSGPLQLKWRKGKKAPCGMASHCNAVVCKQLVYFQPDDKRSVYVYNTVKDTWSQLPDCMSQNSSMAVVNGMVTTIGGSKMMTWYSKKLYSLTMGEKRKTRWTEMFPPMPTKRSQTMALCSGLALVVAGGEGKGGRALTTVEVMNTESRQWSTAADLPEPLWGASASLSYDAHMYLVGGVKSDRKPTSSVYVSSLNSLLRSCQPMFQSVQNVDSSTVDIPDVMWSRVADLPVRGPTCVFFHNRLMVVGGEDANRQRTTAIHMNDPNNDTWEVISHMSTGRNQCFAAVLPDNQLMVVGGWIDTTQDQTASDAVEFATVVFPPLT